MHQMGLVCALTLSVISGGFRMDWDPALGEAIPIFLRNHPSAFEEAAFVTAAIAAGVTARTMRAVPRDSLKCILPLGVAVNSAGKRRLIWDGRHVNRNLRKRKFRMETLQREGRQLFERSLYGGTADISSAYHHIEMEESATPFLGFEWEGAFYCFDVLPFGLSSAPWLFTTVMGHCARFLRYTGVDLICYLDDIIFGADSARGALQSAQFMLRTLRQFGWLIHPTKCVGVSEAVQTFTALGTLVDLATQTYSVPAATVDRILPGLAGVVTLTTACLEELRWWIANLRRVNGCPIRSTPLAGRFDSVTECDASDTGFGAITFVEGLAAASSTLVAALLARGPALLGLRAVLRRVRRGIEYAAALPGHLLDASSTLRELYGVAEVVLGLAPVLQGGRHKVVMDNLGCVFIMGGVVPPFATGSRQWGEFVSGGSPNPELQRLAVAILDAQIEHRFTLTFVWVPRDLNVRADFLSHAAEGQQHSYSVRADRFAYLDGRWGPHSIDRFATIDNRQPLAAPHTGRFCSQYFHPEAEWTDALTVSWAGENNWVFPPFHLVGAAIAQLRASGAMGTLVCPSAPWAPWWHLLRSGTGWTADVVDMVPLGAAEAALSGSSGYHELSCRGGIIAVRLGRRS